MFYSHVICLTITLYRVSLVIYKFCIGTTEFSKLNACFLIKSCDLCSLFIPICNNQTFNSRYAKGNVHLILFILPRTSFSSNLNIRTCLWLFKYILLSWTIQLILQGPEKHHLLFQSSLKNVTFFVKHFSSLPFKFNPFHCVAVVLFTYSCLYSYTMLLHFLANVFLSLSYKHASWR